MIGLPRLIGEIARGASQEHPGHVHVPKQVLYEHAQSRAKVEHTQDQTLSLVAAVDHQL